MSQHYETLFIAKSRLRSFIPRWKKEEERLSNWEGFQQDTEGVCLLIHQTIRAAKSLRKEVSNLKIALQALGCYDYEAVRNVLYPAMSELSELQELDAKRKPSRAKDDHEVTAYVRKHRHKYKYNNMETVRQYIMFELKEKVTEPRLKSLYNQLDKDLRKRPLKSPKTKRKIR